MQNSLKLECRSYDPCLPTDLTAICCSKDSHNTQALHLI